MKNTSDKAASAPVQPGAAARAEYCKAAFDIPDTVRIPGTRRSVRVRGVKPYTLERLTRLWLEREAEAPGDAAGTLRSACAEPYFSVKQAALFVLNGFWRINLLFPLLWRWWAYVRGYTEEQMTPVIAAGKKKLPLTGHWTNMVLSVDMRTDWMSLTKKEAEQYRAERLSAAKQPSSRSSRATGSRDGSSSASSPSAAGATDAS